jgi:hypothetical protein
MQSIVAAGAENVGNNWFVGQIKPAAAAWFGNRNEFSSTTPISQNELRNDIAIRGG